MKQRTITGAILAAILIPIILLSEYIIYPITLSLLCLMAVYEVLSVLGASKRYAIAVPSYLMALALPSSAYFWQNMNKEAYIFSLVTVIIGYMIYLFFVLILRRDNSLTYSRIAEIFTMISYVVISFTALSLVMYIDNGTYYFWLVLLAACITDIFAYLTGMLIGKHKLAPEISPKKTIEGSLGGMFFATLSFVIYGIIVDLVTELQVNYVWLILLGIVLSVVGQIGDLLASVIKREHGVKDYGNLLPGHGGIMDRFDSVLAVAMVMLVICHYLPPFK